MKKVHFFSLFIIVQVFLVFFYIYTKSTLISLTFDKQKYEEKIVQLREKHKKLEHQFLAMKNRAVVKKYAQEHLGMEKVRINSFKRLYEPAV